MSSNTLIYIKRSEANNTPGTLHAGELAYSYASNTLFIGANTATGPGYLEIGGQFYTNVINNATETNTPDTLVLRDGDGSFAANVVGADTIIVGGGVGGNIAGANTVYANYFFGDGSGITNIPSSLTFTGDTGGPNTLHLITDTLTFNGASGITTTINGNSIEFDVDDTVFRANSGLAGSVQFVDSPVVFTGNVTFSGNTFYNDVTTLNIADPIIYLAANNYSGDTVDIGFAANYYDGEDQRHTGLFRHNSDKEYYLFDHYLPEPGDTNVIDPTDASFRTARLHVEKVTGNVLANNVTSDGFLAYQGAPDGTNGYSFVNDGGLDTGMFSPSDGELELWSNDQRIITANTSLVFFERDLKLQNAGLINNPSGLLELNPDETNLDDRYIVIDPTAPNHIHLRAGGTIDASTADLFLGGEYNYVKVSDGSANVEISTDGRWAWQFTNTGRLQLANGTSIYDSADGFFVDPIRANNAVGGNVTAYNTTTKELVHTDVKITNAGITLANGTVISDGEAGFFVDSLAYDAAPLDSANIVLYNATTGEITYGPIGDLNPAQVANGSHSWTVSADTGALYSDQGTSLACSANSVVLGIDVDVSNSNEGRVAIGWYAGSTLQSTDAVAIGTNAGGASQDISAVAIGNGAGETNQSFSGVAVGRWAGQTNQGWDSVAVGRRAGRSYQGGYSVAMGWGAGVDYQGSHAVAIGDSAGGGYQSAYAVAIGDNAGNTSQGWAATSLGHHAGQYNQSSVAVAIGASAGQTSQGQAAVAIGRFAGANQQNTKAVAIGRYAGNYQQGTNSIAIGEYAGYTSQANYSIVLNASGDTLNGSTSGFFVNPIAYTETQDATYDGVMFYNANTKEVRYSYALDGGSF
jgi:hypothetical protein